jgi:hypothetical protein
MSHRARWDCRASRWQQARGQHRTPQPGGSPAPLTRVPRRAGSTSARQPLEERGRRGDSPSLAPASRALEFGGDFLARSGHALGRDAGHADPGLFRIGRFGQGPMDSMAVSAAER